MFQVDDSYLHQEVIPIQAGVAVALTMQRIKTYSTGGLFASLAGSLTLQLLKDNCGH